MNEESRRLAEELISERGPDGALAAVRAAIEQAHSDGDNYGLSVWREVRRIVRDQATKSED